MNSLPITNKILKFDINGAINVQILLFHTAMIAELFEMAK